MCVALKGIRHDVYGADFIFCFVSFRFIPFDFIVSVVAVFVSFRFVCCCQELSQSNHFHCVE